MFFLGDYWPFGQAPHEWLCLVRLYLGPAPSWAGCWTWAVERFHQLCTPRFVIFFMPFIPPKPPRGCPAPPRRSSSSARYLPSLPPPRSNSSSYYSPSPRRAESLLLRPATATAATRFYSFDLVTEAGLHRGTHVSRFLLRLDPIASRGTELLASKSL